MNPLPAYIGSKGSSGVAKRLISLMPPHDLYVEAFLGGGAVLRLKRPADMSVGIDLDASVIEAWSPFAASPDTSLEALNWSPGRTTVARASPSMPVPAVIVAPGESSSPSVPAMPPGKLILLHDDFVNLLAAPPAWLVDRSTFIYCDPPYLLQTRKRLYYRCELHDPLVHAVLLSRLLELATPHSSLATRHSPLLMVSHYPCPLYDSTLAGWRRVLYQTMTRGGPRTEACYMNYAEPAILHDARFAGAGFRERERIKRKSSRWQSRFAAMPAAERQIVAMALAGVDRASLRAALGSG